MRANIEIPFADSRQLDFARCSIQRSNIADDGEAGYRDGRRSLCCACLRERFSRLAKRNVRANALRLLSRSRWNESSAASGRGVNQSRAPGPVRGPDEYKNARARAFMRQPSRHAGKFQLDRPRKRARYRAPQYSLEFTGRRALSLPRPLAPSPVQSAGLRLYYGPRRPRSFAPARVDHGEGLVSCRDSNRETRKRLAEMTSMHSRRSRERTTLNGIERYLNAQ